MNKKLIALAVSSAVAAPMAAQADVTVYGRINNAVAFTDSGDSNDTDIKNVASRFGIKASSDLGNGLTATARYEFSTNPDRELPNPGDLRIGTVGISGGFGSITIGNQWSAYFDTFGTLVSPTYTLGYFIYSSIGGGPFRASNTIKYSNSFGPVYLEVDARFNDSDERSDVAERINGNGFGIGASFDIGPVTIAAAYDNEDSSPADAEGVIVPEQTRTGIAGKVNLGPVGIVLGTQVYEVDGNEDIDSNYLNFSAGFGNTSFLLSFSDADTGSGDDAEQIVFGAYQNLGGGLKAYLEATSVDFGGDRADTDIALLGLRIDF